MQIQKLFKSENNQMKHVYKNIIQLALIAHCIYIIISFYIEIQSLLIYNALSSFFYIFMLYLISKEKYKIVVSCIHIEVSVFVCFMTYMLGWHTGFPIYLLSIATLVYFCPFNHKYIPYFFSITELILFMLLKGIEISGFQGLYSLQSIETDSLYVLNTLASFGIIIIAAWISNVSATVVKKELLDDNIYLEKMVNHDQLTGLASRHYLFEKIQTFDFQNQEMVVAIADIDDFKVINDTYGHACGDYVLKELGQLMLEEFHSSVFICRWGGEEFLFIFSQDTYEEAVKQMEKFMQLVSEYVFTYRDQVFSITMTTGLSKNKSLKDIYKSIDIADQRLYYGKNIGKNKTVYGDEDKL